MTKLNWKVIHECDDEDGNPACWAAEINHPKYGKYVWINAIGSGIAEKGFNVEVNLNGFTELVQCKSLTSAKRWVATQLVKKGGD